MTLPIPTPDSVDMSIAGDEPEVRLGSPEAKARTRPSGAKSLLEPAIVKRALKDAFTKLDPRMMVRNPVMFVVELGSVLTTLLFLRDLRSSDSAENVFAGLVTIWLWFTVLFANFAEAVAEGRCKAPADTLRAARTTTVAHVLLACGIVGKRSTAAPAVAKGTSRVMGRHSRGRGRHPGHGIAGQQRKTSLPAGPLGRNPG